MPNDSTAIAIICLIACLTFSTRVTGMLIMAKVSMSQRTTQFLDYLSTSVIAAMVASLIAQNGLREGVAVAIAAVVMLQSKSAILAMISGMLVAAFWANLI